MSAHWFDLSAIPAKPRKRVAGLVVTTRGVEWYAPPKVVRNRSGKCIEVKAVHSETKTTYTLVDRSVRSVASVRSGPRVKAIKLVKELAPEVAAPVMTAPTTSVKGERDVAPAIVVADLALNPDTSWHEVGKGSRPLRSFAQRKAAVKAARGW